MPTTIVLADDHKMTRQGLRALLEAQSGLSVVGEGADGHEAVEVARRLEPDLVVMDVGMPNMGGIEATRRVIAETRHTKVIALSMHSEARYVCEMLRAGASAYLLKDCAFEELVHAIEAVGRDTVYLSPEIAETVVDAWVRGITSPDESAFTLLSAREREVLQLLAEGKSTRETAETLYLSVKTIESHRSRIMAKLDIRSIPQLTKYAIREGITPLDK